MQNRKDEDHQMTEAAKAQAELTAQTVVARILDAAKDKEQAAKVIEVWGDELDRVIGRAVRRALLWIGSALAVAVAVKLGAIEKLTGWMK